MGVYIFLCVCGVLAVSGICCGIIYQYFPVSENYELTSEHLTEDQRIVLLTDLHACEHGKKNKKLLTIIDEAEPDYICIAGDMTVKNGLGTESVLDFMIQLSKKYRVYYAPGNHEIRMPGYDEYKKKIKACGICYLQNESIMIGGNVVVYGIDLPEYWYHKVWEKREFHKENICELIGPCRKDCFSILLAHNPEYGKQYAEWGADLTLCGHLHGGIMRLPYVGGVISPSLRLFPKYDAGLFEEMGKKIIVSRGLGLHHIKLRFFNRPEVSVINLSCQKVEQ